MKYSIIFTTVITLALTSQVVTAGSIADTYATGDTLTATNMENIKTAVNGNDGNIGTNTTAIGDNTTGITANDSDIANNVIGIETNAGNISSNITEIGINTLGIANNDSIIGVNTGNIDDNAIGISDNTDQIGFNTLGIANNASNIAAGFSGDGSAGDLITDGTATDNWLFNPPANPFFNDVIINAGETLTVPAGTTIRCTGSFTNNGTLQVLGGADNRGVYSSLATSSAPTGMISAIAHPGDTPAAAILGTYSATSTFFMSGGPGGLAIPQATAITSFSNFRIGGGSGLSYYSGSSTGGGLVKIYCTGPILNASGASILATGDNPSSYDGGTSGGGGGIVVLASRTSIDNADGVINVSGGNGADSSSYAGSSGGGGGGIIVMVAPTAPVPGTDTVNTIVTGGLGGTGTTVIITEARMAGSGGGGSGGAGGTGGYVSTGTTSTPGTGGNGGPGYTITMTLDPITVAK